jgi:hypothetical protein
MFAPEAVVYVSVAQETIQGIIQEYLRGHDNEVARIGSIEKVMDKCGNSLTLLSLMLETWKVENFESLLSSVSDEAMVSYIHHEYFSAESDEEWNNDIMKIAVFGSFNMPCPYLPGFLTLKRKQLARKGLVVAMRKTLNDVAIESYNLPNEIISKYILKAGIIYGNVPYVTVDNYAYEIQVQYAIKVSNHKLFQAKAGLFACIVPYLERKDSKFLNQLLTDSRYFQAIDSLLVGIDNDDSDSDKDLAIRAIAVIGYASMIAKLSSDQRNIYANMFMQKRRWQRFMQGIEDGSETNGVYRRLALYWSVFYEKDYQIALERVKFGELGLLAASKGIKPFLLSVQEVSQDLKIIGFPKDLAMQCIKEYVSAAPLKVCMSASKSFLTEPTITINLAIASASKKSNTNDAPR